MRSIALFSQGDPLEGYEQPGSVFNIIIRKLGHALAQKGVDTHLLARRHSAIQKGSHSLAPHLWAQYFDDGDPVPYTRDQIFCESDRIRDALGDCLNELDLGDDALFHSHYWSIGRIVNGVVDPSRHLHSYQSLAIEKALKGDSELELIKGSTRFQHERHLAGSARIVPNSPQELATLRRHYGFEGNPPVVPLGTDPDLFKPMDKRQCRRVLKIPEDRFIFLYAGRFCREKGMMELIDGFAQFLNESDSKNALLVLTGQRHTKSEAIFRAEMQRKVEMLGIVNNVTYLTTMDHEHMPIVYSAADVVVMPSHFEHFGLVAIEAMACGRSVIGSDRGGTAYTIAGGKTGLLVDPFSGKSIAQAMGDLHSSNDRLDAMGKAARERVLAHFTWDGTAEKLIKYAISFN